MFVSKLSYLQRLLCSQKAGVKFSGIQILLCIKTAQNFIEETSKTVFE